MSTVLVTGRNGFIGRELVRHLKKTHKVISVVRHRAKDLDYNNEELIQKDLRAVNLEDIKGRRIDIIAHLAAHIRGSSLGIEQNNIRSSENIFNIAESLNVPVLYVSSVNVLFENALGGYARSKKICEESLKKRRLHYLIIRVPLVIGGGSPSVRRIRTFYGRFSFFPLLGPQQGKVQPVAISSLVEILLSKLNSGDFRDETINVVGVKKYSYRAIIENLLREKRPVRFLKVPLPIALWLGRLGTVFKLSGCVSPEEIKSINMDKIIEKFDPLIGQTVFIENDEETLFTSPC
ncbi:MAG: hypothetical protein A3D87_03345 [Omnitrophica WOR_2 bacterium RIFCSPHIGHO2_02_FULL_50_17]|nr:MAG: hypothetical protein A3D87_03345 [Omnitrophica WOR_2 bacterium RIFCSPHIGHO2_02_FULL_50_17]